MQRGLLHRKAYRVGLLSVAAVLVSACSSDADRLSFFGVDRAQPQTVAVAQPAVQYSQPVYQQAPMVQPAPVLGQPQVVMPTTQPIAQPVSQPAPYTAPNFTAPGYPQTTASISQPTVQLQPTYQALPQPVAQPVYRAPVQTHQVAVASRTPVNAPNAHLVQTPGGLVGQSAQQLTYQAPQVSYQSPQVVYQAPQVQTAPLTTASINPAPQPLMPRSLADPITTASIAPVQSAPQTLTAPQALPAALPTQSSREAGWSGVGGTRVQVQQGETLFSMSRRYGIPVDVLQRVNNISDPSSIRMGQQITIPVYSTASAGTTVAAQGVDTTFTGSTGVNSAAQTTRRVPAPTPRPSSLRTVATAQPMLPVQSASVPQTLPQAVPTTSTAGTHVVASGDTLYGIARRYNMSAQQLIAANSLDNPNALRIGQRLVVSSSGQALPQVAQLPSATQTPAQVVAARSYTPPTPAQTPVAVQQTAAIQQVAVRSDEIAEQTPLQFRWPIRGRVLSGFGTTAGGVRNDGVNIAVPEGASIRAAEEGEVVYAGSELRGFGNLVLIQHRGGYVTAYAHNSRIDVQRGDRVSRGDVIARAGSTGDVDTPQLHFEIRRGTTPVDPSPYLPQG
ncbi:MAG: peptidoglycan DD-metalloendopeptidase family protein [Devosiaceae bacterium]